MLVDNGWSIGYNVSRENAGIFPRRNIYPVQEDISSIFPPARPKNRPIYLEERIEDYVQSDEIGKALLCILHNVIVFYFGRFSNYFQIIILKSNSIVVNM